MTDQTKKKWLAFLAIAPIAFIVIAFVGFFVLAIIMATMGVATGSTYIDPSTTSVGMIVVIILFFLTYGLMLLGVIFGMAAIILYIIMACRNPAFDTTQKVLWSVGIYCFGIFICLVYWAKFLRD